jgi:hypothetical protein
MRIALLVALSALVAGCSGGTDGSADGSGSTSATGTTSSPRQTTPTTTQLTKPSPAPSAAPQRGASIADVIEWIEAGTPADVAGYHSMTRGADTTDLGDGVAFTTAGGVTNCVTNRYRDNAVACLVKLTEPPARPAGVESAWKANWVDFTGTTVDVGSPHGDPGPFGNGTGAELPAGQTLAFGGYRCRADSEGVVCVDYGHRTAVALSARGVEPFGCLKTTAPPADIGLRFSC